MALKGIRSGSAFAVPRKGETFELRSGLVSQYAHERKETIQRVIAAMTLGKDVSALFPDVLKNIATHDLAQKKLVYLYLINYAKSHPDLCILAVNTFVQDSEDPNPLVRALAIRTMGCIRVTKILDYLTEPLRKTLKDDSPYVRKTAAICVGKLYDLDPERCISHGFLEALQSMISDANPMVVANAVVTLFEIQETDPSSRALVVSKSVLGKLLVALNECTEWGRVSILDCVAVYETADEKEAEHICERVVPQFQHANASVVLSAVKVVLKFLDQLSPAAQKPLIKKVSPPLVTLLSSKPEVQYVALRNINFMLQKRPDILSGDIRVFFCKFNDPEYVKLEKLDVLVKLANDENIEHLLAELKEYAAEVDVDFVRRSVRAIGLCALKLESAAKLCVQVLMDLIQTKVDYVVQESVIVVKDIFRKYPSRYEGIIPELCRSLEDLDEPGSRAAMIWIIGEYAQNIGNADDLLGSFLENFNDEYTQVQLQLLTAVIKLFLKKPKSSQQLVQNMLQKATAECDNADIRDRAYIYWRLLSADPAKARAVVLGRKPEIQLKLNKLPADLLDELMREIGLLSSVFHKPPSAFLPSGGSGASRALRRRAIEEQRQLDKEDPLQATVRGNVENLLELDFDASTTPTATPGPGTPGSNTNDLLEAFGGGPGSDAAGAAVGNGVAAPQGSSLESIFGDLTFNSNGQAASTAPGPKTNEDILGLF